MPRTYKKKKIQKYSKEDLEKAINEVRNKESTIYAAGLKYGIPNTTLFDQVKRLHPLNRGRPIAIPLEQEQQLASGLRTMEKWGFGLARGEILQLVCDYVKKNNIETPFKDDKPGPDWFINFKKRHSLSVKKPQPVEYVRKKMTDPFVIYDYFELLENTLAEENLFQQPDLIWNMDETSLCLDPTRTKVVGAKNKPCSRTTFGSGKENITVLAAASASGQKISPLIIYKGKNVWDQWMASTDNHDFELAYAASTKGWMEAPIFLNYLERVFIPALGEERPVLIIFDGHSTHVTLEVVYLAIRHGIIILKMPPHTSHLLQPLDVAVFKSFKCKWDAKMVTWQRHNVGTKMPKKIFAQTFADTWQETSTEVIRSGFKKTGIHPFDPKVITEDKFDPAALQRYKDQKCKTSLKHPKSLKTICVDALNMFVCNTNCTLDKEEQSGPYQPDFFSGLVSDSKDLSVPNLDNETPTAPQQPNIISMSALDATQKRTSVSRIEKEAQYTTTQDTFSCQSTVSCLDSDVNPTSTQKRTDYGTNNVILLTKICRHDIQNKKFVASKTSDLPKCLVVPRQKHEPNLLEPKAKIISNIKVNFEDLLLAKITQDKKDSGQTTTKKRVAKGAEVITAAKVIEEREKQIRENATKSSKDKKSNKRKKSNSNDKTKSTDAPRINKKNEKDTPIKENVTKKPVNKRVTKRKTSDSMDISNRIDIPSTSGIKKNKKKKLDSSVSSTDISETMSIYSDYDIDEYYETLRDENLVDIFDAEIKEYDESSDLKIISQNPNKETSSNIINTKTKNKGVGKKTKFEENNKTSSDSGTIRISNEGILNENNKIVDQPKKMDFLLDSAEDACEKNNIKKGDQKLNDENCDAVKKIYNINDSVLVRYYNRRKWTYYIGFIKNTIEKEGETHYCVDFLKTLKKPQLRFIETKKVDHDVLSELFIVKSIFVKRNLSNLKEYYLVNDCDKVYFQ